MCQAEAMKAMTEAEREELINSEANTPLEIKRLLEGLSPSETRWKPESGEFSVLENICHLRDIEAEGYSVRIKRILADDNPFLEDIDGAAIAKERDYNSQELKSAVDAFTKTREENIRILRGLSFEQLVRIGTFQDSGQVTLERLVEMIKEHDDVHIAELKSLRTKIDKGV